MLRKNEVYSEVKKVLMENLPTNNDCFLNELAKEIVDTVFALVLDSKN